MDPLDFDRLDPDPHQKCGSGIRIRRTKNDPQKQKKFEVLNVPF
jgi:hypothetical protein